MGLLSDSIKQFLHFDYDDLTREEQDDIECPLCAICPKGRAESLP